MWFHRNGNLFKGVSVWKPLTLCSFTKRSALCNTKQPYRPNGAQRAAGAWPPPGSPAHDSQCESLLMHRSIGPQLFAPPQHGALQPLCLLQAAAQLAAVAHCQRVERRAARTHLGPCHYKPLPAHQSFRDLVCNATEVYAKLSRRIVGDL